MKTLHTIYTTFAKRFVMSLAFLLSVGSVWGMEANLTFTTACNGQGMDNQGNIWLVESDASESVYDGDKGVHYGTSKKAVSYLQLSTSTIPGNITKIVVNASGASGTSAKLNIQVGGAAFGNQASLTASAAEYSFIGEASGEIIVKVTQTSAQKALYVKSIVVTYATTSGGDSNEDVSVECGDYTYNLVTDVSELEFGDQIIIAAAGPVMQALSTTQNNNNRGQIAIVKTNGNTTVTANTYTQVFTLTEGTTSGTYGFYTGAGYLYAASSSSNYLKTQTTNNANGSWKIAIDSSNGYATINAQGTNTHNLLCYNATSSIFSCYASSLPQSPVSIYKKCSTEIKYTIYFAAGKGGSIKTPTTSPQEVGEETGIDIQATPSEGYEFKNWTSSSGGTFTNANSASTHFTPSAATTVTANFTPISYKISYQDVYDVTHNNPTTYNIESGEIVFAKPTSERIGYTFAGWEPKQITEGSTGDQTTTARWTPVKVTITWNANEGSVEPATSTYTYDSETITLPIPTRTGYTFLGWFTSASGGTEVTEIGTTNKPTKDVTYYAQWQEKNRVNYRTLCVNEVVFNTNGGDELYPPIEYTVKSEPISLSLYTPYRLGYDFAGWYTDQELTTQVTDIVPKDHPNGVILYAKWTLIEYTITFDTNGGEAVTSQTYTIETETFELPQATRTGYTFAGWCLGEEKVTQIAQGTTGDKTLVAQWTPNIDTKYQVKHYKENLDGTYPTEATNTDNLTGTTGASVTPLVKSYDGFTAPETQTVIIAADGSLVVEYKYTRNSYQLTWKSDESTEISSAELKYGAEIVQPADPTKDGYIFAGWNPVVPTTMPATDKTFVAQWTKLHTITWYANGVEYTEGDPTTIVPNNGTLEKLPTPPSAPSGCSAKQFIGWSETNLGMTESTAPADLFTEVPSTAILEDKQYYAVFYNPTAASGNYEKVTTELTDWSGEYLIVYETGEVAFNGGLTTLDVGGNTVAVTIENNAIEANDVTNAAKFTIAEYNEGYSIQSASGYYIGYEDSKTNGLLSNLNKKYENKITLNNDKTVNIQSTASNILRYNPTDLINSGKQTGLRFRYYKSGQEAIALYKKAADNETYVTECDNCIETTLTITPDQTSVNLNEAGKATVVFSVEGGNGGAITYAVTPSTNVTITDNQLDFTKEGEYTIYATQEKTGDNCPTKSDFVTITVTKNPVLYFETEPSPLAFEAVKCGAHTPLKNKQSVSLKAYNLIEDVTATVSSGYLVARTASATLAEYQTSVFLTKTDKGKIHSNYNTVYVIASPSLMTPETTGTLTFTTTGGNTLTVNLSTAEVTCEKHTLTFKNYNSRTKVKYYGGERVVEPEAPTGVCQDRFAYEFDGWAEEIVSDGATTYKKVDFKTYTMPNRNTILYAVYRYPGAKGDYEKVTTAPADWSGEYLIVYESGKKAFNGALTDLDATDNYVPVTISSDKITATDEVNKSKFTIAAMDGGYSIQSASGYYIGCTASADKNGLTASTTVKYANTISLTDIISKNHYLRYNTVNNENRFRYYKSNTNDDQKAVALYKRADAYLYTSNPDCIAKVEAVKPTAVASKFSVAADKQVQFSTGNLQYHNKDGIWRFAENQYDVIGEDNINIGNKDYRDWVDMFGWSSDGYYGVNPSNNNDDYQYEFVDWGRVFADAQYGSQPVNQWYTMSYAEWNYLLNQRNNHASLQQLAAIQLAADEEIFGNLLFPDEWTMPTDVTPTPKTDEDGVEYYLYDLVDWSKLETAGAVFLPSAGRRTGGYGNEIVSPHIEDKENPNNFDEEGFYRWQDNTNYTGYYWTSSQEANGKVYFAINLTKTGSGEEDYKASKFQLWQEDARYGQSVRLVRECASVQVVEWKENSVMVMTNAAPEKASVKINGGTPQETTLSAEHVKVDHGVYQIGAADMDANALIEITFDTDNTLLTIPYIATGESTGAPANSDLVILNGATYTATSKTLRNVTIYGGGTLVVPEGVTLSVNSLTMRVGGVENDEYQHLYPQLILQGTLNNASGTINLDYLTTYDRYYALSLPYAAETKAIHFPVDIYGKNVDASNKGSFALQYYDGAARAAEGKGWKDLPEPATLNPYQGYTFWGAPRKVSVDGATAIRQKFGIHRIPMVMTNEALATSEKEDKSIGITAHESERPVDAGWNYIGNPYLAQYGDAEWQKNTAIQIGKFVEVLVDGKHNGEYELVTEGDLRYVTTTTDGVNYEATSVSEAALMPFNTYFIQAFNTGTLSFVAANRGAKSLAARTLEQEREITTGIILSGEGYKDRTGLLIADSYGEAYEFNADLSKFENQDINLYTISDHGKLAYMAINQELAKQTIPVGYAVSVEGTYTIAFDELRYNDEDIHELLLIDYDRNETTDLLQNEYQFYSEKGEYTQRLALQVALAPKVSTDIEQTEQSNILIYREGNMLRLDNLPDQATVTVYDAVGRLMQQSNASEQLQLSLHGGYYLIHVVSAENAVVLETYIP